MALRIAFTSQAYMYIFVKDTLHGSRTGKGWVVTIAVSQSALGKSLSQLAPKERSHLQQQLMPFERDSYPCRVLQGATRCSPRCRQS